MTTPFSELPECQIQGSMVESVLIQPMLYVRRLDIFPRKDINRRHTFASTSFLYEMMVISSLNYEADEFLESCAGSVPTDTLWQLINNAAEFRRRPCALRVLSELGIELGIELCLEMNGPARTGPERGQNLTIQDSLTYFSHLLFYSRFHIHSQQAATLSIVPESTPKSPVSDSEVTAPARDITSTERPAEKATNVSIPENGIDEGAASDESYDEGDERLKRLGHLLQDYGSTWDGVDDPNDPYIWSTARKITVGVFFMVAAPITFSVYFLGHGLAPFLVAAFSELTERTLIWAACNVWFIVWNALCPVG
ncbi:hypothetical protein F5B18DRAFT_655109 [Nemania serpens]|nr:hypothetical protein F5B18DRAFT_655109 [Nemania serpens]